jgi:signal peptidase I
VYDFRVAIGESMIPTYRAGGDLLLIEKLSRDFKNDDIVIVNSPVKPGFELCKRIIATEGETVIN